MTKLLVSGDKEKELVAVLTKMKIIQSIRYKNKFTIVGRFNVNKGTLKRWVKKEIE